MEVQSKSNSDDTVVVDVDVRDQGVVENDDKNSERLVNYYCLL